MRMLLCLLLAAAALPAQPYRDARIQTAPAPGVRFTSG